MRLIQRILWNLVLMALALCAGCETAPKQQPRAPMHEVLRITNHVGGTHYRTIVRDRVWYQTFSNTLLVVDARSLQPIFELELGTFGSCGPAVDMALVHNDLFIVLEADRVLRLSLDDPVRPEIVEERPARELGVLPRQLSVVTLDGRDEVFVCGDNGAARFAGGPVLLPGQGVIASVAIAEPGLVATIGRRVYHGKRGDYLGAATHLQDLPDDDRGAMIFAQAGDDGALVGIMEPNIRERSAQAFTKAVAGRLRRVRYFDGSIWIVTDAQIVAYTVDDDGLTLRDVFAVKGARDVDMLRDNYLAVAGSFGRAVYRIHPDSNGPGDTFVMAHREPGLLTHAVTDQLQILAGAPEQGTWLYQIGSDASLLDQTLNRQPPTSRDAVIDAGTAAISDDLKSITLRKSNNAVSWQHPGQHQLHCVIAVEGRLWVGHERGVAVLDVEQPSTDEIAAAVKNEQPPPQPRLAIVEDIWLHGPVRYVFALLTGRGAAYVATYGGFGTVEFLEEAIPVPAE